jgi:hypothetical protein
MAQIYTETLVVEVSRIAKKTQDLKSVVTSEVMQTVEAVVQELVGDAAVVEVRPLEE